MSNDVHAPAIGLPPDLSVGPMVAQIDRTPWHIRHAVETKVWDYAQGEGETVAILDTGVSAHPDLPEPVASKSFVRGESPDDPTSGHGTHCAGTAVGRKLIGMAPKAKLIRGKVLSNRGSGSSDGIAAGIRWAADNGATIISMSLGGGSPYRPTQEAIDYAWSKGIFVNAAAGNAGYRGSNTVGYPAKFANCVCCGATQENGSIANFSSGGRELDWAGPGQDIISCSNRGSGYQSMSGTSMATPYLSGCAALLREMMRRAGRPLWKSIDEFRLTLSALVDDRGPDGRDVRFGEGVPTFDKIITAIARPDLWA